VFEGSTMQFVRDGEGGRHCRSEEAVRRIDNIIASPLVQP
jgi:hypothetical protein